MTIKINNEELVRLIEACDRFLEDQRGCFDNFVDECPYHRVTLERLKRLPEEDYREVEQIWASNNPEVAARLIVRLVTEVMGDTLGLEDALSQEIPGLVSERSFFREAKKAGLEFNPLQVDWLKEKGLIFPLSYSEAGDYSLRQLIVLDKIRNVQLMPLRTPFKVGAHVIKCHTWQDAIAANLTSLQNYANSSAEVIKLTLDVRKYRYRISEKSKGYVGNYRSLVKTEGPKCAALVRERYSKVSMEALEDWRGRLMVRVSEVDPLWRMWGHYPSLGNIDWQEWRRSQVFKLVIQFYDTIADLNLHIGYLGGRKFNTLREALTVARGKHVHCVLPGCAAEVEVVQGKVGRQPIYCPEHRYGGSRHNETKAFLDEQRRTHR